MISSELVVVLLKGLLAVVAGVVGSLGWSALLRLLGPAMLLSPREKLRIDKFERLQRKLKASASSGMATADVYRLLLEVSMLATSYRRATVLFRFARSLPVSTELTGVIDRAEAVVAERLQEHPRRSPSGSTN